MVCQLLVLCAGGGSRISGPRSSSTH
jgi:hypothetical protein